MTSARTSPRDIRTQRRSDAPLVRARRRGEPHPPRTPGRERISGLAPGELPDQLLDRLEVARAFRNVPLEWMLGLFQAEAIDPSVTSPLCAAKAARTSSFSRGGTPK
jgi:hypothetical protein